MRKLSLDGLQIVIRCLACKGQVGLAADLSCDLGIVVARSVHQASRTGYVLSVQSFVFGIVAPVNP